MHVQLYTVAYRLLMDRQPETSYRLQFCAFNVIKVNIVMPKSSNVIAIHLALTFRKRTLDLVIIFINSIN